MILKKDNQAGLFSITFFDIKKSAAGYTLIEILAAIGIFLFITTMMWLFVKQSYRVQSFTFGQSMAITEARRGVEILIKEAREALPGDTGAYMIVSADDNEFIFYADYDRDDAIEKVRYFFVGTEFFKGVIEASGEPLQYLPENEVVTVISKYVRNEASEPVFTYYDGSYAGNESDAPLTMPVDLLALKLVHINLRINVEPEKAPTDYYLASDVQIRNLKDNL